MKNIRGYLTGFMLLVAVGGVLFKWEARYAKADHVNRIEQRLDEKITQDRMESLQERMWAMEDRWGERFAVEKNRIHDTMEELLHFMTKEARDHYRRLQSEYEKLAQKLKEKDNE